MTPIPASTCQTAQALVQAAARVLITTHVRPDGDAIGSIVALQDIITTVAVQQSRPLETQLLLLSEEPDHYQFLLDDSRWIMGRHLDPADLPARLDAFDLIIVADTCALQQLPEIGPYLLNRTQPVLVIDHHLSRDPIGTCQLFDTDAAAAAQIVFDFATAASWPISPTAAAALFAGLCTDTGWFRFENASPACYQTAAQLIAAGARPEHLYHQLFQNFPIQRTRLIAEALRTVELHCSDRLAVMQITRAMLADTGASRSHIENIINECHQIGSVLATILLVEQDDGTTRCSFRSRAQGPDVNVVACQFGGGGHARAAGARLPDPLPQARTKLITVLTAALT